MSFVFYAYSAFCRVPFGPTIPRVLLDFHYIAIVIVVTWRGVWYINCLVYEVQFLWLPSDPNVAKSKSISRAPAGNNISLLIICIFFLDFVECAFFTFSCMRLWQELSLLIESSSMAAGDKRTWKGKRSAKQSIQLGVFWWTGCGDGLTWMWMWMWMWSWLDAPIWMVFLNGVASGQWSGWMAIGA